MVSIKKLVYSLAIMIIALIAFSSCNKESAIEEMAKPQVSQKEEGELRGFFDDIYYNENSSLGSHVSPMQSRKFYIPAKTAYCLKMTDEYRNQFSSYNIFVKFDPAGNPPSGSYFEFDRKRNNYSCDDSGNIDTKTIYVGGLGHTNSYGPQMEGWGQPDFQWVRIRNPHDYPLDLIITMNFNNGCNCRLGAYCSILLWYAPYLF